MGATRPVHHRNISPFIRYSHEIELRQSFRVHDRKIYDHEFIFGIAGQAMVAYEGATYRLKPGDLFLIRPHRPHTMSIRGETPFRCICVHFDWTDMGQAFDFSPYAVYLDKYARGSAAEAEEELTRRPTDEFTEFGLPNLLGTTDTLQFLATFRELDQHFRSAHVSSKLMMKAAFLKIMALISQELTTNEGIRKDHPHADKLLLSIRRLHEHYASKIVAADLASMFGFSPKYFGTIFKKATGLTVSEYLLNIRLDHAKRLLSTTTLSIEEIGEKVGLSDSYYFSKVFKKREGIPPGQYRKSTVIVHESTDDGMASVD